MKLQSCKDTCPETKIYCWEILPSSAFQSVGFCWAYKLSFGIYVMDLSSRIILLSEATQSPG